MRPAAFALAALAAVCVLTSANFVYYFEGVLDCSGAASSVWQADACLQQGTNSIAVTCDSNVASFSFYSNTDCFSTPAFQNSSRSGQCSPFPQFASSYVVYCGDSPSPSPSASPSPSNSASPYPSQSPCKYCDPWGQYGQNPAHTLLSAGPGPLTKTVLWTFDRAVGTPPVLSADNLLYISCAAANSSLGTNSVGSGDTNAAGACAVSVASATPSVVWVQPAATPCFTSPALNDAAGQVYYYCAQLFALDRSTGAVIWQNASYEVTSVLVVYGGALYFCGYLNSLGASAVVAMAADGSVVWSAPMAVPAPFALSIQAPWAYAYDGSTTYQLDMKTGSVQWMSSAAASLSGPRASMTIGADSTLYVITYDEHAPQGYALAALSGTNGSLLWNFNATLSTVLYNGFALDAAGVLYVLGGSVPPGADDYVADPSPTVYAIDARTGEVKWQVVENADAQTLDSPLTSVVVGSNGVVYYSGLGFTFARSTSDGSLLWKDGPQPQIYQGALLLTGTGTLVVCSIAAGLSNLACMAYQDS